jgi:glucose-6-phosphate isomerase
MHITTGSGNTAETAHTARIFSRVMVRFYSLATKASFRDSDGALACLAGRQWNILQNADSTNIDPYTATVEYDDGTSHT